MKTLSFVSLALMLGFKHSYDADHLMAVSTILTRKRSLHRAILLSACWATGHMATASIITFLLFQCRDTFLNEVLEHCEMAVGIMLIVLGVWGIAWEFQILPKFGHRHRHRHKETTVPHDHVHAHPSPYRDHAIMLGIGVVHGLASNDELLTLLVTALGVTTLVGMLTGVAVFSAGVVAGMLTFSLLFTHTLNRWNGTRAKRVMALAVGLMSIAYGVLLLYGRGFNQG